MLLRVGCISGAIEGQEYSAKLTATGFDHVEIEPTRVETSARLRCRTRDCRSPGVGLMIKPKVLFIRSTNSCRAQSFSASSSPIFPGAMWRAQCDIENPRPLPITLPRCGVLQIRHGNRSFVL